MTVRIAIIFFAPDLAPPKTDVTRPAQEKIKLMTIISSSAKKVVIPATALCLSLNPFTAFMSLFIILFLVSSILTFRTMYTIPQK